MSAFGCVVVKEERKEGERVKRREGGREGGRKGVTGTYPVGVHEGVIDDVVLARIHTLGTIGKAQED